jgi:hypothetical protein
MPSVPEAYCQSVMNYVPYAMSFRKHTNPGSGRVAFAMGFPRERFVWSMVSLNICLTSAILLEAIYMFVTGRLSIELPTIVSGLIGSFTTAFLIETKNVGGRGYELLGSDWFLSRAVMAFIFLLNLIILLFILPLGSMMGNWMVMKNLIAFPSVKRLFKRRKWGL